jgi:anti-anti-sigma regulatory factor
MSAKENNPSLLSKVAKFVSNPTTNWTDLDKQDPEPDAGYSKQALKEMIERKRQNDFVRKREFDQLRKLRSRDPGMSPELGGRPSYFQSSLPANSENRANTVKKIDEIEAQMSNQWWQGKKDTTQKSGAPAAPRMPEGAPDAADVIDDQGYAPTRLSPMRAERVLSGNESSDFPPTQDNSGFGPKPTSVLPLPLSRQDAALASRDERDGHRIGDGHGFTHSRAPTIELVDGMNDAEMEEAAIRFANGDDEGAESGLKAALDDAAAPRENALRWASALLDLYRATGRQTRFDRAAIAFAERFDRSAPTWFSMPDAVGRDRADTPAHTVPSRLLVQPIWVCQAGFDAGAVDELRLAVANMEPPWFLDWSGLQVIQPDAVAPLAKLFAQWCETSVDLRFSGARALEAALRNLAASGNRTHGPAGWKLRLDALRIMRLQDEFELVALDYCVTFEVSPPAWIDARCSYHGATIAGTLSLGDGSHASDDDDAQAQRSDPRFAPAATVPMALEPVQAAVAELSGEILGEAAEALNALEQARNGSQRLVVSCANLIRVDFSAAGSILNWVATLQTDGCQIQFREVHRLVAAFFGVIGINEHARIVMRSD